MSESTWFEALPNGMMKLFHGPVRAQMNRMGKSSNDLASSLGVSKATVSGILHRRQRVSATQFEIIARELNLDMGQAASTDIPDLDPTRAPAPVPAAVGVKKGTPVAAMVELLATLGFTEVTIRSDGTATFR
jgi:transcriptional regulator with XRE-family HTH domain